MGEMENVDGGEGVGSDGAGAVIWTDLHCPGGSDIIIPLNYLPDKHQGMCCSTVDQSENPARLLSTVFGHGLFRSYLAFKMTLLQSLKVRSQL